MYIINYARGKLKKVSTGSSSRRLEINVGDDSLSDWLPFDIMEPKVSKKRKITVPKWGIWVIAKGSMALKDSAPTLISKFKRNRWQSSDPVGPLNNPYNDNALIQSILDEIDKL